MQTINIDKLKDLKGYEWKYKSWEFLLLGSAPFDDQLTLVEKNYIDADGYMCEKRYRSFSLKNLTELEFYGLKVVLNEKPKLSKKDREFFKKEIYIARDSGGGIYGYFDKPVQSIEQKRWRTHDDECFAIDRNLFSFITWESGKAWSKAELMELEVIK